MSAVKLQNDQFIGNKIETKKVKMDDTPILEKEKKWGEEELFLMGRC
jgi:hypothetical protein